MGSRALGLLPWLLALVLALAPEGRLQGPVAVLRVVDGDTVELQGLGPVRLIGIDAPESTYNHRTSGPEEVRLGLEAKAFLARLLQGRKVWVELDAQERDRYRRVLAYLYLEDPRGDWIHGGRRFLQVNLELVRAGWAEPYTVPPQCPLRRPLPPGRPGGQGEGGGDVGRGAGLEAPRPRPGPERVRPRLSHGVHPPAAPGPGLQGHPPQALPDPAPGPAPL
ncbi:hypothetical protein TthSNM66_24120 (plasmid) [Thermus thermophilus]|uniref:thermonuclease family protein n=1 Tax=Thermus thermophilus TaxID=274 RepID=UPI001FCA9243|nr:thermonuclease family protein [Thermus thermophilus]BDG27776.1 hypothetical protein TthSNM66_24120 [Thermus thermophilus]